MLRRRVQSRQNKEARKRFAGRFLSSFFCLVLVFFFLVQFSSSSANTWDWEGIRKENHSWRLLITVFLSFPLPFRALTHISIHHLLFAVINHQVSVLFFHSHSHFIGNAECWTLSAGRSLYYSVRIRWWMRMRMRMQAKKHQKQEDKEAKKLDLVA